MVIFGIYVNFLGCNALLGLVSQNDPLKKGLGRVLKLPIFITNNLSKRTSLKGKTVLVDLLMDEWMNG